MLSDKPISRRDFLKISATAAGGLVIGATLPTGRYLEQDAFSPNLFVTINPDGTVVITVNATEMGQGVMTALPMLVAEELEVNWDAVKVRQALADPKYGMQITVASRTIHDAWQPLRQAGATARELLISAAANIWGVRKDECLAQSGAVYHRSSGRRVLYRDLAARAATMPAPDGVELKQPGKFSIIGKSMERLDTPGKLDGRAEFGIDVRVNGMVIGSVLRCPVPGGKVKGFDGSKARNVKGVIDVLQIESGIAVVADDYWTAMKGREKLDVEWEEGENTNLSSERIFEKLKEAVRGPSSAVLKNIGEAKTVLRNSRRIAEAHYYVPPLAHAAMEPVNCTADVREHGCSIWAPTQAQTWTQLGVAGRLKLPMKSINLHTTQAGGGFGRKAEQDFVTDAVQISQAIKRPVKVVWSREDDIQHDFYRPPFFHYLRASLDDRNVPEAWSHYLAGPSMLDRLLGFADESRVDWAVVSGAESIPYDIPHFLAEYKNVDVGLPVGYWRSTSDSYTAFANESFIDEIAALSGLDPLEYRLSLLEKSPRTRKVVEVVADKAGWCTAPQDGVFRGLAIYRQIWGDFKVYTAQVAELSVSPQGHIRVHRIVAAVDCGQVINPDIVEAQIVGGIVFGLTATLHGEITIQKGSVQQSNYHDYPLLRMAEMPKVEVHLVESHDHPGGVGEKGVPAVAPAIANAVFAATGKRIRQLPIRRVI